MAWKWQLLRAGAFRLDGGSMFGVVPKALWSRNTPADDGNRIGLQTNCLLLERNGELVVVEVGYGGKWSEKERAIYAMEPRTIQDALADVGVSADDINHVVVTHLHFDHAGGLTMLDADEQIVPTFPNATIHVQHTEWHDALANKSTMTRTYLKSHLEPVADMIEVAIGEAELLPGLSVWPMVGHTWGQQAVRFKAADGVLCFPGDVLPTAAHVGLAYNMAYDVLPYENMHTKRQLLTRAQSEDWRIVIDHEPGDPVVRVAEHPEKPGRFVLEPTGETEG